jgi:hypothetical protein
LLRPSRDAGFVSNAGWSGALMGTTDFAEHVPKHQTNVYHPKRAKNTGSLMSTTRRTLKFIWPPIEREKLVTRNRDA